MTLRLHQFFRSSARRRQVQPEVRQRSAEDRIVEAGVTMHNEFTAVFERDGDWHIAYCPEIPGANGQGRTKQGARESLAAAIALILADRREDGLRAVPPDAERETVTVE
jgi:predicted RNase H-like HicB family nuclease